MKLTKETFETLQDGLDLLFESLEMIEDKEEQEINIKRVKEAEGELIAIGTY